VQVSFRSNGFEWLQSNVRDADASRPLWVISRHFAVQSACPLYPQKRTFGAAVEMSAKCHNGHARLFDHLVSSLQERGWDRDSERLRGPVVDD
jgi:hypothetical protein